MKNLLLTTLLWSLSFFSHINAQKVAMNPSIHQFEMKNIQGEMVSLETYKGIEKHGKDNYNTLVFGPWDHGGWTRSSVKNIVGGYYWTIFE